MLDSPHTLAPMLMRGNALVLKNTSRTRVLDRPRRTSRCHPRAHLRSPLLDGGSIAKRRAAAHGLGAKSIRRTASSDGLLATSFGGLQPHRGLHFPLAHLSLLQESSLLFSRFPCSMFSHTSSFLGGYSICMHHTSLFCFFFAHPPTLFPTAFPSCVFLFSLRMCTPMCYLFGGLLVSCYFLSSSRTIGFSLTSLPAASKIGAIDL